MHIVAPRLRLVRIAVHYSIDEARPAWTKAEREGVHYPFQGHTWLSHWYTCLGRDEGVWPCLVRVEDAKGNLLLFLPFGLQTRRGARVLVWLGGGLADYNAPILGPGFEAFSREVPFRELWDLVVSHLPPFDAIHFIRQPEKILDRDNPFLQLGGVQNETSAHAVRLDGGWEALYERACGARTRQTDRRHERKLEQIGTVVFDPDIGAAAAGPVLETLFAMKSRRYRETGSRDWLQSQGLRAFYAGLVGHPAVRLAALQAGGRVVAAHWGVVQGDRFYYLLPAFDNSVPGSSPGAILSRRLMQWACETGLASFDYTVGDEPYKDRWCDRTLTLWDHVATRGSAGRLYVARLSAARLAAGLAQRLPALHRLYRGLKANLRRASPAG